MISRKNWYRVGLFASWNAFIAVSCFGDLSRIIVFGVSLGAGLALPRPQRFEGLSRKEDLIASAILAGVFASLILVFQIFPNPILSALLVLPFLGVSHLSRWDPHLHKNTTASQR